MFPLFNVSGHLGSLNYSYGNTRPKRIQPLKSALFFALFGGKNHRRYIKTQLLVHLSSICFLQSVVVPFLPNAFITIRISGVEEPYSFSFLFNVLNRADAFLCPVAGNGVDIRIGHGRPFILMQYW